MNKEDKELLLEMKRNCLKENGTTTNTYNDEKRIKKAKAIDNVLQEIDRLNNIRIKALEYIYKDLVRKNVNWDYDDVIGSDLPAEAIKPLVDILEGNENEKDESDAL